jgi:hypothetical protein
MKIFFPRSRRDQSGSMLITASVAAAIIAIIIGSILAYLGNEYAFNMRSHRWTQALSLAEAGVEMGFAEFNNYYLVGSNGFSSARGWYNGGGGTYYRWVSSYTNGAGVVDGSVYAYVNGVGSAHPYLFAYGYCSTTPRGPVVYRAVECQLFRNSMFPAGMVAKGSINMNGNNVTTDSYDSTDLAKSTNSQYDASKRQANGDIATNNSIINSDVSLGNANIHGTVATGASGSVSMGPNGTIGPTFSNPATTVAQAQSSGWVRNDFAVDIPDVNLPSGASSWSSQGSLGNKTLSGGTYKATDITLKGNDTLTINGNVSIYITGSKAIAMGGNGKIVVSNGATLTIYSAGDMSIAGNGIVNNSTSDMNVQLYGLPTCTSVSLQGNGNWSGIVYAPEAAFSMGGGGSSGQFSGGVVANTIDMNGEVVFHYDEALRNTFGGGAYNVASWKSYRWTGSYWASD